MHNEHSLVAKLCNYFLTFSFNKMDNLMKRIVQNELENHGEPPEKKEKPADLRLGKLLEKICGKQEPINNAIKKKRRVHFKWKRSDPI